jgi:hypothetical protein
MEALLLVAEHDGPTMLARIGMMRALNRSKPAPKIAPRHKRKSLQDHPVRSRQDRAGSKIFKVHGAKALLKVELY